jgi:hypothetical protein
MPAIRASGSPAGDVRREAKVSPSFLPSFVWDWEWEQFGGKPMLKHVKVLESEDNENY